MAFATNTAMAGLAVLFCLILRFFLVRENKKMDEREAMGLDEEAGEQIQRIRYVL
jgi:hypothetical protein